MGRILLGSLVAAIIAFVLQAVAWMGNFYPNFTHYTPAQDSIMKVLSDNLEKDGLYWMPTPDPKLASDEKEQFNQNLVGKPWAMVFYHQKMDGEMTMPMIMGFVHNFISAFFISLVIFYGSFRTFWSRFLVAFTYILVVMFIGISDELLWWGFPYQFICPQYTDMLLGWGLASVWLAFFVRKKPAA